jgi:hypothetical protein
MYRPDFYFLLFFLPLFSNIQRLLLQASLKIYFLLGR